MAGILRRREGQQSENREMARQTQSPSPDPFQWLTSLDPFRFFGSAGMNDPFRRMREMLNVDPFAEMGAMPAMSRRFVPDFEVREKNDCYVVCADLPGLTEDDLNIEVTGNRLTISGKREEEQRDEGDRYWAYERSYGSFARSFMLPEGTMSDQINASIDNGVLEIRIPKAKAESATKIPIKSGTTAQTQTQTQGTAPTSGVRQQGQFQGGTTSTTGQSHGSTQTGTIGSTGQESAQGGAHEKAA